MEVKDREKSLIKNTGILAMGTLASKIFSFFLLPLYTAVLTTEDYGTVDVLQTVSSFAMPFVTLQLSSAIFRFIIEKKKQEDQTFIITTGILIEIVNIILFTVIVMIINFFYNIQYCGLFIIYFISSALLENCQNITRGFGNNKLYSLMSFLMTIVSATSNIIMILGFGMHGDSILIASSLAYLIASLIAIFKQSLWKYFKIRSFSPSSLREMFSYCLPLIPNAVSWWLTNTSDRLLIRLFLGVGSNGIYAAANKIPTIYTTIYNVYNIAWIEALSRSVGDKNQKDFINSMFEKSIKFFSCICLGIICCISIFFNFLVGENYQDAYPHVYILLVAIFFNSIASLYGGVFTALKKSTIIGKTTVIGACVNFFVNLFFIKFIGLYAASISTLISYLVIVLLRKKELNKVFRIKLPRLYLLQLLIVFAIVSFGYFYNNTHFNVLILIMLVIWSYYINKNLLNTVFLSTINKFKKIFKGKK